LSIPEEQKLEIREARPEDAEEIARLNKLFNEVNEPAERYAARLADPNRLDKPLLALREGRAVGMANLRLVKQVFYAEPYAELTELYVEEAYRRQGIARALIRRAERLALEAGATEMVILTGMDNQAAQTLYRNMGFQHLELALKKPLT
jgi:ribosomal protein S18 acetylase RimI-like enzyme